MEQLEEKVHFNEHVNCSCDPTHRLQLVVAEVQSPHPLLLTRLSLECVNFRFCQGDVIQVLLSLRAALVVCIWSVVVLLNNVISFADAKVR